MGPVYVKIGVTFESLVNDTSLLCCLDTPVVSEGQKDGLESKTSS